jgi:hypothetical protein
MVLLPAQHHNTNVSTATAAKIKEFFIHSLNRSSWCKPFLAAPATSSIAIYWSTYLKQANTAITLCCILILKLSCSGSVKRDGLVTNASHSSGHCLTCAFSGTKLKHCH